MNEKVQMEVNTSKVSKGKVFIQGLKDLQETHILCSSLLFLYVSNSSKWQTSRSQPPPTGRLLPSSSRGPLAPSRARLLSQARRGETHHDHTFSQCATTLQTFQLLKHQLDFMLITYCLSPPFRFGDDIPGMEGLGTDITVVCPWEAFGDMELSDLAKYGIV